MTREADVVRSLVEMADTLVEDYDVVDLLTGLADRCVDLLGVSAAGVMLASPAGSLGLVASSSEAMRLLELFELQAQEGPRLDAFRTGEPVGPENLQAGAGRWPLFAAAALQAGFASASALPLRLREATLGAMNLLSITRAPMDEADLIVARAFADLATLSITQHRASAEAQRLNEQLSAALTSRVVIEQAKGVICERAGVDLAEAFTRLRAYARNHNLRLTDVAQAAIDGTLDPAAWAGFPGEAPRLVHLEVSDDGRTVAAAEVITSEGPGGTARVSLRAESGHITPGRRASLVDAVLDLPQVRESARLEAAFRLGDSESLQRLQQRCADVRTRPAGWSALLDAGLPPGGPGSTAQEPAGEAPCQ